MRASKTFAEKILDWYDVNGRKHLPWRQEISPYRVWVSEIMLQQTQVKTVIPYFERFMARFPTLMDLAAADADELMHHWTGLGYYARARNLHRAAKQIVEQHAGIFPNSLVDLQSLTGIGRSTAGAISSIAFQKPAPILDANVKRVLTRYHAFTGDITETLWDLATQYTPQKRPDDYAQAMMDLGAMICVRANPRCDECPLVKTCKAYLEDRQKELPEKKHTSPKPIRETQLLIFHQVKTNQVFLVKRPPVGIWGGLWSFPECAVDVNVADWCKENLSCDVHAMETWPMFKHVFTHFTLKITPIYISNFEQSLQIRDSGQHVWHSLSEPELRGVPTPVKNLFEQLVLL